jgi:hypothetical protein
MQVISLAEIYENGFTIVESIGSLVGKRFEELYEDPDPQETIRLIALSQDSWSFSTAKYWLKRMLIASNPARRYSSSLEDVVEYTLLKFYSGDQDMSGYSSMAEQKATEAKRQAALAHQDILINEIYKELNGVEPLSIAEFISEVIQPKYSSNLTSDDFSGALLDAIKRHVKRPDFVAQMREVPTVQDLLITLAAYPELAEVEAYLQDIWYGCHKGEHIPDVTPTEEESVNKPWSTHISSFETKTLRIGLVQKTNQERLIEIGLKDSPTCYRFVESGGKFIGVGDNERALEILTGQQWVDLMLQKIVQDFA